MQVRKISFLCEGDHIFYVFFKVQNFGSHTFFFISWTLLHFQGSFFLCRYIDTNTFTNLLYSFPIGVKLSSNGHMSAETSLQFFNSPEESPICELSDENFTEVIS